MLPPLLFVVPDFVVPDLVVVVVAVVVVVVAAPTTLWVAVPTLVVGLPNWAALGLYVSFPAEHSSSSPGAAVFG